MTLGAQSDSTPLRPNCGGDGWASKRVWSCGISCSPISGMGEVGLLTVGCSLRFVEKSSPISRQPWIHPAGELSRHLFMRRRHYEDCPCLSKLSVSFGISRGVKEACVLATLFTMPSSHPSSPVSYMTPKRSVFDAKLGRLPLWPLTSECHDKNLHNIFLEDLSSSESTLVALKELALHIIPDSFAEVPQFFRLMMSRLLKTDVLQQLANPGILDISPIYTHWYC